MTDQGHGSVELVLVDLGDAGSAPATIATLTDALESRAVRLVDVVFLHRDPDGTLRMHELEGLYDESGNGGVALDESGLAGRDGLATHIPAGNSAALVVSEHASTGELHAAIATAGAEVVTSERIAAPLVNALLRQIRS